MNLPASSTAQTQGSQGAAWSFVHAADLHLDTPMPGRDEAMRRALRAASRAAFERMVDLALEEKCAAVFLAGDVVDSETLSMATEDLLCEGLERLAEEGIRVFIAPGNHDHYRSGSPMQRMSWPENVTVFQSIVPVSEALLDASGVHLATIHGVGHTNRNQYENLVSRIKGLDEPVPQIGLVHTHVGHVDVTGRHDPYAPSELKDFHGRGIDYWAIGHIHSYHELSQSPWVIYPGCIMGRDYGETGEKGCVLVRVHGRDDMETEFRPLAPVTFHHVELDIADMDRITQFFDAVRARWREVPEMSRGDEGRIVRIIAGGRGPLSNHFRRELSVEENLRELEERLERSLAATSVEFINRTAPPLELEDIGEEVSIRGEYVRLVRELIRDPDARRTWTDETDWRNPDWGSLPEDEQAAYVREALRAAMIEGVGRLSGGDTESR